MAFLDELVPSRRDRATEEKLAGPPRPGVSWLDCSHSHVGTMEVATEAQ